MVHLPLIALLAGPWSIMTLGDSITQCSKDYGCYRPALAKKLASAGFDVRFVGSRHNEDEPAAMMHEGYGGKTAEFLAANFDRLYRQNPADVILLHAGHNHFVEEQPLPGILAATEEIIVKARIVNPAVVILLAQVIPAGKLPKYSYIPALNRELARLAERMDVVLVDQAAGFDVAADAVADKVHPSASGAEKMAAKWFEALRPVLSGK
jgi:lysophospholipase L1-like esterase